MSKGRTREKKSALLEVKQTLVSVLGFYQRIPKL